MITKKDWPVLLVPLIIALVAAVAFAGVGVYFYRQLTEQNIKLTKEKKNLENQVVALENNLTTTTSALQAEQARNNAFASELSGLASTVGTLDKLSKTDKELLQKYSKIYFLSEHYVPGNLATITPDYLSDPKQPEQIHANVWPRLKQLMDSASSAGVNIRIASAYRSFGQQSSLKSSYAVTYGSGANKFSADQGYSEHQLGTAVDFVQAGSTTLTIDFADTPAGKWLVANAYRFGFVMSYPKGNAYYQYEPWHWRFVGVTLATKLHAENKYFYNLPQRTIDQYLVNIFD